ncbi:MAG: class I SAM-dependent methyltransferase [Candidatus Dormibacteria bacterium]
MSGPAGRASDPDWDNLWQRFDQAAHSNPAELMRFRLALRFLGLGDRAAQVVDIGSGQGELASIISRAHPGATVLGVELSATGVRLGLARAPSARFLQWDLLEDRPVPKEWSGWATHAVCSEVLEHVDDPARLLGNARRFLAPGCRLVVTVPGGPRSAFDLHIGHRRHYDPGALARLLDDAGFERVVTFGAGFPFFNLYRLAVIARGRRLIDDVTVQESGASLSAAARLTMRAFDRLFRCNLTATPWGWQIVGIARLAR